jgi:ubiquinone/menaquinone biosynthesis C-methylase UbiE
MSTVRTQYDRQSRSYDRRWARYTEQTTRLLLGEARIDPGERVLDVACGTGAAIGVLLESEPGQSVTGVDLSPGMLDAARRTFGRHPNVAFREAPAEALPFDPGTFDVVISASALHYFERPATALSEMVRVLVPGGRIVILDWNRAPLRMALLDAWLRLIDPAHGHVFTAPELRALLEGAGVDAIRIEDRRLGFWSLLIAAGIRPTPAHEATPL